MEKSSKSQTKDKEGKSSLGEIQTTSAEWDTIDLSEIFSNQDMEMEISPNLDKRIIQMRRLNRYVHGREFCDT